MSKREVPTLVRRAVTSVGTVARHPIAGTARAVGLVKGSAVAAPRLVRHVVAGAPAEPVTAPPEPTVAVPPAASSGSPDVVPKPVPEPVRAAWKAVQDMFQGLDRLNAELEREGLPPLAMVAGLSYGDAVVGHLGARDRFNYTAIGDAVNVAARLQEAAKRVGDRL